MRRQLVLVLFALVASAACGRRGTGERCEWNAGDAPSRLNLQQRTDRLHLMDEALLVEDLAVRYADFHRGHRSGHFAGDEAYQNAREQCMATLVNAIAEHHGVGASQVSQALTYRRVPVDVAVVALFVVFYLAAAQGVVRWMFRSISADAP